MSGHNVTGKRIIPKADHPVLGKRYRDGETLQQIANTYGVSRERIRQILRKINVDGTEGGSARTARLKKLRKRADWDRRMLRKYGCTVAEWRYINDRYGTGERSPFGAYRRQKENARKRDIPFRLTFWDWWMLWYESGKWEQRGIRHGQYVMSRYGDEGAYEVGNVHIVLSVENIVESLERRFGGDYSETVNRHKEAA